MQLDISNDDITKKMCNRHFEAIVIGASAGGIKALLALLKVLPATFRLPIVIVLHMPDTPDSRLADVFQHHVAIKVSIAVDKETIKPQHIYFAGPGYHLSIENNKSFSVSCEEPIHYSRPSIDLLMSSAADAYGAGLIGVLLTGANQDGAEGMVRIHQQGGITIVQDPDEAEIAFMPQSALDLFTPDFILPLQQIQTLIFQLEKS